jgi:catechol 2,3-dioxygenase-like lactoylglutathione lyase family enzyme
MNLSLIAIKGRNIHKMADFYTALGFKFSQEQHGSGPKHYAAELAGTVFEIYPLTSEWESTIGLRLGFNVKSVDEACEALASFGVLVHPASDTEWDRQATFTDPEGHKVDLIEKKVN